MALTLPSSNGNSLFNARSESIQVNTNFNGGLTQTTSTLTPTRLKNIQDAFLEQHSLLPPKPYLHEHMAGFVPPTVNVSLHVKHTSQFQSTPSKGAFNQLAVEAHNQKSSHDYNSANSNSNDSYSDDYSSETNSSTADTSHYSFNHFLPSSVTKARSKSSVTMNTRARASTRKSKSSSDKSDASTSSQPKKSTGGGRKPNNTEKLTPEEELKRAKRRERNKLAAARCRKRRVDQTNLLVGETTKLEKEHQSLVEQLNRQLAKLSQYKEAIDSHETHYCKRKHRLPPNIFAAIDYQAIQTAMEPIPEDDFDGELDDDKSVASGDHSIVDYSHNFGDDLGEEEEEFAEIVPPKRKRPNSLPLSKDSIYGEAGMQLRPNVFMTTPSNGLYLDCFESTGLTPLVPTVTATELTPSTMAALIKTLASPDDS